MTKEEDHKEQMRKEYFARHPIKFTSHQKKMLKVAERVAQRKKRRLEFYALLVKLREVDNLTYQKIGSKVGLTRQRIQQLLSKINS